MSNIATHKAPAWGPKANFIIRADISRYGMAGRIEQLWARKLDYTVFQICCIPFFTYGLALGDTVESDIEYTIQHIRQKSGHKTLRVAVGNKHNQDDLHGFLHSWVENAGCLYEWFAPGYLAVDVPPDMQGRVDVSALDAWTEAGDIYVEIDE